MAEFPQRLPLPRLVHFLDMILPQIVPVQSPCQSRRRRFASSYRIAERTAWGEWDVECTLNATKLFWSMGSQTTLAFVWNCIGPPEGFFAKTQNPKQVSLNPKAQLLQITSPANLLLDTRTRTNQEGWQSFSL